MKGLGRNIRFMTRKLNEILFSMLFMMVVMAFVMGIVFGEMEATFLSLMPMCIFMPILMVLMMNSMNGADFYLLTAISMGATRKHSSMGSVISQHIFLLEMGGVLWICALLVEENEMMQVVRSCPWGSIGILLLVSGLGIFCSIVSLQFGKIYGALMMTVFMIGIIFLAIIVEGVPGIEINAETLKTWNTPISVLIGLAVDLIASFLYCRVLGKVDLKLA